MIDSPPTVHEAPWSVVGARGWIGSHLCTWLRARGATVAEYAHIDVARGPLGHLVWCTGVPYGSEQAVRAAYRAHLVAVERWLDAPGIASFAYLSSTRVYDRASETNEEDVPLVPADAIYALTKAAGERLVLACAPNGRVLRLSNVYGSRPSSPLFLNDVLRQAAADRRVRLRSALDSAKDYVGLAETVALIPRIALAGSERVYNVAAGENTSTCEILETLRALDPRLVVEVAPGAPRVVTPRIAVERVQAEFGFRSRPLTAALPELYGEALRSLSGEAATPAGSGAPDRGDGAAWG